MSDLDTLRTQIEKALHDEAAAYLGAAFSRTVCGCADRAAAVFPVVENFARGITEEAERQKDEAAAMENSPETFEYALRFDDGSASTMRWDSAEDVPVSPWQLIVRRHPGQRPSDWEVAP